MKTAEEIAYEILGQMDDFTQTMIRRDWIVECVQAGMDEVKKQPTTDTARMEWLERNLMTLYHNRATSSVYIGGECVHGQMVNEARGRAGGPSTFRVCHRSIREAVDAAMGTDKTDATDMGVS